MTERGDMAILTMLHDLFQGEVKFLTGGNQNARHEFEPSKAASPRAERPNRCDPGTDGTVRMKETHPT